MILETNLQSQMTPTLFEKASHSANSDFRRVSVISLRSVLILPNSGHVTRRQKIKRLMHWNCNNILFSFENLSDIEARQSTSARGLG